MKSRSLGAKLKKNMPGWLIIIPGLILFAFFVWIPLFESIRLSLYSTKGMRLEEFVGFSNYVDVYYHPDFMPALINTFKYIFWSLAIGFPIPIIMALIMNEIIHAKGFIRVGTYLPNIVPGLATILMWRFFFTSGDTGVLNIMLDKIGISAQTWLSNPSWTIIIITLTMTWKGAGATALIYLAGLQGISQELYEAATIDGASIWNRLKHITFPNIYNLARTLLILQFIAVFQILYEPLVMTNGGPNNASISIMQLVYKYAFEKFDYSKAAAVSVIICIILILINAIYNKVNKEVDM